MSELRGLRIACLLGLVAMTVSSIAAYHRDTILIAAISSAAAMVWAAIYRSLSL